MKFAPVVFYLSLLATGAESSLSCKRQPVELKDGLRASKDSCKEADLAAVDEFNSAGGEVESQMLNLVQKGAKFVRRNGKSPKSVVPVDEYGAWNLSPPTSQQIYVLRIPKCAGTSFVTDLSNIVGRHAIWTQEATYDDRNKGSFNFTVTMLRNPRKQVHSEYRFCHSEEYQTLWDNSSKHQDFESWVSTWASIFRQGATSGWNPGITNLTLAPFGCYWPVNMQTRAFTSPATPSLSGKSLYDGGYTITGQNLMRVDVGVDVAISNMMATDVVGLAEAYQESICLFHAVYRGALPRYCNCADEASWGTFEATHEDHGVGHYRDLDSYPPEVVSNIDVFTADDRPLYKKATKRFLHDIHSAETRFGMKILCRTLVPLD